MILLRIEGLTRHFGDQAVLDGVTASVRAGSRVALVGPNGVGKTTLLKTVAGEMEPERGIVECHDGAGVGFLRQHAELPESRSVWDEARSALEKWYRLVEEAEQLAQTMSALDEGTQRDQLAQAYDRIHEELLRHNAYHLDHRVERVLHGLRIPQSIWQQACGDLSGGEQRRLMLAQLLLAEHQLLLLDEPTNHLDLEACQWLENYLVQSNRTLLIVSHDRYLLNSVATETWELFEGTVDSYPGNFTRYIHLKEDRVKVQVRTYERQQEEIEKLKEFVRRHHHGQKHAQAEDRRKKLERIESVPKPRIISVPPMQFAPPPHCGEIVARSERLGHGFDRPLFGDLTFDVLRGEKWGILGSNGTGKTTLLKCIAGQLDAKQGRMIQGAGVQPAYFDQHLSGLSLEDEAIEAVRPDGREFLESNRRDLLAKFGITGDMAFQKLGLMSGGERTRVALAQLAAHGANLLIMDEPTNQLDLWARQALESALKKFDGTVIFASHDRYFVNQIADRLLVFEETRVRIVHGNYDTYRMLIEQNLEKAESVKRAGTDLSANAVKKSTRSSGADETRKKRKFPYRKIEDLEADIANCESDIQEWHEKLSNPEVLRDGGQVKSGAAALEKLNEKLASLYLHWEETCELDGR